MKPPLRSLFFLSKNPKPTTTPFLSFVSGNRTPLVASSAHDLRPPATSPPASRHPRATDRPTQAQAITFPRSTSPPSSSPTEISPPEPTPVSPPSASLHPTRPPASRDPTTVEAAASIVIFPGKPTFSSVQLPPHEPPSSTAAGRRPSHGRDASTQGSVDRRPSRSPPPSSSLFSSPTVGYAIGSRATTLSSVPIVAGLPGCNSIVGFLCPSEALSTIHR